MAGPWLKMECSTPDKPQVLAITAHLGWDDPDLTVGKLFRLWRWFDQHTIDGNAPSVTPALIDRHVGVVGFVAAVQKVGWISVSEAGLSLPNFDDHNGESAKARALAAKRAATHRAKASDDAGSDDSERKSNGDTVTKSAPRGRDRGREEEREGSDGEAGGDKSPRPASKCPQSFEVTPELLTWAAEEAPDANPVLETKSFRDHTFKPARADWPGTWRNWMRKAQKYHNERNGKGRQGAPIKNAGAGAAIFDGASHV